MARIRALFADYGEILTTQDVAKVLGATPQTITNYINDGSYRAFRMGERSWRIVKEDLIEDIARTYNDQDSPPRRAAAED